MDPHTEFIVSEVKQRPVLWDKKHKSYHYRDIVDNNWQIIGKTLGIQKVLLKRKWKGIRDQFRVELKKIPNATTEDFEITDELIEKYTVWPHFKSLLFLKDQMKIRGSNPGIEYIHTNEYDSSIDEDTVNDPLITTFHVEETVLDEKPAIKKMKTLSTECKLEQPKLAWPEKKAKSRNDDEAFFESLMPYVANMGLKTKMLCRMEIQKVVYNYAFSASVPEQGDDICDEPCVSMMNAPLVQMCTDKKPFNITEFIM